MAWFVLSISLVFRVWWQDRFSPNHLFVFASDPSDGSSSYYTHAMTCVFTSCVSTRVPFHRFLYILYEVIHGYLYLGNVPSVCSVYSCILATCQVDAFVSANLPYNDFDSWQYATSSFSVVCHGYPLFESCISFHTSLHRVMFSIYRIMSIDRCCSFARLLDCCRTCAYKCLALSSCRDFAFWLLSNRLSWYHLLSYILVFFFLPILFIHWQCRARHCCSGER